MGRDRWCHVWWQLLVVPTGISRWVCLGILVSDFVDSWIPSLFRVSAMVPPPSPYTPFLSGGQAGSSYDIPKKLQEVFGSLRAADEIIDEGHIIGKV